MNSTLTGPVATYLADVKAQLSDLPPGEFEDVLEDVSDHLSEVAAEFDETPTAEALHERLGTPRQYADELRTAAGYPPRTEPVKEQIGRPVRTALGRRRLDRRTVLPADRAVQRRFRRGPVLRPDRSDPAVRRRVLRRPGAARQRPADRARHAHAARGPTPGSARRSTRSRRTSGTNWSPSVSRSGGWPAVSSAVAVSSPLFGAGAVAVVGALAGAAVSIWVGRRTQQDRRWLWYVVPLNVVATIIVPAWLALSFVGGATSGVFSSSSYDNGSTTSYSQPGLALDGVDIDNVFPFDEQGRQVKVRLYDQDGKPISLPLRDCAIAVRHDEQPQRLGQQPVPAADGLGGPERLRQSGELQGHRQGDLRPAAGACEHAVPVHDTHHARRKRHHTRRKRHHAEAEHDPDEARRDPDGPPDALTQQTGLHGSRGNSAVRVAQLSVDRDRRRVLGVDHQRAACRAA